MHNQDDMEVILNLNAIYTYHFGRNKYFDYMCNEPNEANSLMPSKKKIILVMSFKWVIFTL